LKQEEKFQILKMLLAITFYTFDYLQKQTSGANVVQNVKKKKSNPYTLSDTFNWFNSKKPMHTHHKCKLVTFLHFIFSLVCVGINHQKGEIEREMGLTISYNRFWWLTSITNHMD
jgi:hypothetical protein